MRTRTGGTNEADWFETLFQQQEQQLFRYFSLCLGQDAAEDMVQQTFLKLWMYQLSHPGFAPKNGKAWVFRAAVNIKNDYYRWRKYLPISCELLEAEDAPSQIVEQCGENRLAVREAFAALQESDREILAFKSMGMNSEEVGKLLKISASAARSRFSAAKKRFERKLQEQGILPES